MKPDDDDQVKLGRVAILIFVTGLALIAWMVFELIRLIPLMQQVTG